MQKCLRLQLSLLSRNLFIIFIPRVRIPFKDKCETCLEYIEKGNPTLVLPIEAQLTHHKQKFIAISAFFSIVDICEKTFQYILETHENFAQVFCDKNVVLFSMCKDAIGDIKDSPYSDFPDCHLLDALIKKFVNIRIHAYEKQLNRMIVSEIQHGGKTVKRVTSVK
jgi:hypothetical protein